MSWCSELGVSAECVRVVRALIASRGSSLSAADAQRFLLLGLTRERSCSLLDLYLERSDAAGHPFVAMASVYVAHASTASVLATLDVVLEMAERLPSAYFWIDLFALNYHEMKASLVTQTWLHTTLQNMIKSIGSVLVALPSFSQPTPLGRAWCLWELMAGLTHTPRSVNVQFPAKQKLEFVEAFLKNPATVLQALTPVPIEKAATREREDLDLLLLSIRHNPGVAELNRQVAAFLWAWCLDAVVEDAETVSKTAGDGVGTQRLINVLLQAGKEHFRQQSLTKAIALYERALPLATKLFGEVHANTAAIYGSLAQALTVAGDEIKALEFFVRALETQLQAVGENDAYTAQICANMGLLFFKKNDMEVALDCYQRALAIASAIRAEADLPTAAVHERLGALYSAQGQFEKSLEAYLRAVAIFRAFPSQLASKEYLSLLKDLANLYTLRGDYSRAIEHYETLVGSPAASSDDQFGASLMQLGELYFAQNVFTKALANFSRAKNALEAKLSANHPETVAAQARIAACQEQLNRSEPLPAKTPQTPQNPAKFAVVPKKSDVTSLLTQFQKPGEPTRTPPSPGPFRVARPVEPVEQKKESIADRFTRLASAPTSPTSATPPASQSPQTAKRPFGNPARGSEPPSPSPAARSATLGSPKKLTPQLFSFNSSIAPPSPGTPVNQDTPAVPMTAAARIAMKTNATAGDNNTARPPSMVFGSAAAARAPIPGGSLAGREESPSRTMPRMGSGPQVDPNSEEGKLKQIEALLLATETLSPQIEGFLAQVRTRMLPFDELRRTQIHLQENVTAKLSKLATIDTTDSDRAWFALFDSSLGASSLLPSLLLHFCVLQRACLQGVPAHDPDPRPSQYAAVISRPTTRRNCSRSYLILSRRDPWLLVCLSFICLLTSETYHLRRARVDPLLAHRGPHCSMNSRHP
eukprot:m.805998 g.805998  ORF g.805998 m.805998 type:complete len:930 (+) comp59294_c0_seq3:257-3046(+)